jgi:hypothetical protein
MGLIMVFVDTGLGTGIGRATSIAAAANNLMTVRWGPFV